MPIRVLLVIFSLLWVTMSHCQENSMVVLKKVVIDPGHGGADPGALSADKKVKEKDITLSVSLKLGDLIKRNYPGIEVIYTRKTDVFVALDKRTEIANKNKADLFISIHVNAAVARAATGSETFVMGADKSSSNFEVTMLENSVIMMEGEDYATRYEGFEPNNPESYIIFTLLQNAHLEQSLEMASLVQKHFNNGPIKVSRGIKQGPLLVLWKTSMPSVLIELGFISNPLDFKILNNRANHDKFAALIFNAFKEYKQIYDKDYSNGRDTAAKEVIPGNGVQLFPDSNKKVVKQQSETHYRIQIMAVNKVLRSNSPDLKGRDANYIKVGNLYKYTIGEYPSINMAKEDLVSVRRDFPQAFIIVVRDGTIIPLNK
ncbi:MAG: N-acetylmuramoyl-L-alanine amidase [Bacteroidales bacterium]|nr:N-acetylmuramoyl-L-alanine amidase [Bacteroidales bacterium]